MQSIPEEVKVEASQDQHAEDQHAEDQLAEEQVADGKLTGASGATQAA